MKNKNDILERAQALVDRLDNQINELMQEKSQLLIELRAARIGRRKTILVLEITDADPEDIEEETTSEWLAGHSRLGSVKDLVHTEMVIKNGIEECSLLNDARLVKAEVVECEEDQ